MKFRKSISFLLIVFFSVKCYAEKNIDTLSLAKKYFDRNKFCKAEKLLKPYYENHEGNLTVQWLYAQTTYYAKHFKKSQKIYEDAIAWHPENYYLRLDYAKKLVDIGEFKKAIPILNLYLAYDSLAPDAHNALAKIALWQGDYKTALAENKKALSVQKQNKETEEARAKILQAKSPWLGLNVSYTNDNQPLQKISPLVEAGVWLNPLANLHFAFDAPIFLRDGKVFNAQQFSAGNKFLFAKIGLQIFAEAGFIKLPNNKISGIGLLELKETVAKHLEISAIAEHKAYIYTRANLDNPIMQMHYDFSAAWNDVNSFQGKVSFDAHHFYSDKNLVYTAGAWLLSPPLKVSVFDFRIGYGYAFSNSLQNRFTSEKSLSTIIANWNSNTDISGVYNPYFTPNKSSVNSAILTIAIHPVKIIDIGLRGSIGFYATTQNPNLYLSNDNANNIYIARSFYKQTFLPGEANAFVSVQFNSKINLKAEYTFANTFFYRSNYADLSLKISFWNEKNR